MDVGEGGRRKLEERWAAAAPATRLLPPPKPVHRRAHADA